MEAERVERGGEKTEGGRPASIPRRGRDRYQPRKIWRALAWQIGCLLFVRSETNARTQPRPANTKLAPTIRVYNYARVSGNLLASAEEQVARLFRPAGVDVEWRDCPIGPADSTGQRGFPERAGSVGLVIKVLPSSMTRQVAGDRGSLGFAALAGQAQRGSEAFVFFDRVEEVTQVRYVNEAQLLASVMAHEIGHLLLGPGHSRGGIMAGLVDGGGDILALTRFGLPGFMPDQAKRLRAEVLRRVSVASRERGDEAMSTPRP